MNEKTETLTEQNEFTKKATELLKHLDDIITSTSVCKNEKQLLKFSRFKKWLLEQPDMHIIRLESWNETETNI